MKVAALRIFSRCDFKLNQEVVKCKGFFCMEYFRSNLFVETDITNYSTLNTFYSVVSEKVQIHCKDNRNFCIEEKV